MRAHKILITIAFAGFAAAGMAQYYQENPEADNRNILQLGILGGFNNSNLYDAVKQNYAANPVYGGVFGGFLSIPLGTYLGIQPEILFSQKGYSGYGYTGEGQPYSFFYRSNFVDVPFLFQLKPSPVLYLLGGPEYSYLVSSSYTFTQGVTSTTTEQEFVNNNIRHNIFGLMFGADVNMNPFTLGGRIAWDLEDNNGDGTSTLPRYRNIWGQLTLGFRF